MMDKLPFKVVKRSGTTLVRELVDGFRRAIDLGFYRPGDTLPSLREVARETGVSLVVVHEAFRRIAAEGYADLRRGVGSIVTDRQAYAWRGHIVIASIDIRENYLHSAMTGALRQSLMQAGYMVSTVPFSSKSSTYDFSQLDAVLQTPVTLVVTTEARTAVDSHLAKLKRPFLTFGESVYAERSLPLDCSQAIAAFVDHCRATGVKRVAEVTVGSNLASVRDALAKAGIACRRWPILRRGGRDDILRQTLDAFYSKIGKSGRKWLPDVLYFNDNFATQSALLALVDSGIDIPGDVRLVTWSNAGEGPYWRKSLTRIEIDPIEAGSIFADYVLAYLTGRKIKQRVVISPKLLIRNRFSGARTPARLPVRVRTQTG